MVGVVGIEGFCFVGWVVGCGVGRSGLGGSIDVCEGFIWLVFVFFFGRVL